MKTNRTQYMRDYKKKHKTLILEYKRKWAKWSRHGKIGPRPTMNVKNGTVYSEDKYKTRELTSELDDMLSKGIITKEEYDKELKKHE